MLRIPNSVSLASQRTGIGALTTGVRRLSALGRRFSSVLTFLQAHQLRTGERAHCPGWRTGRNCPLWPVRWPAAGGFFHVFQPGDTALATLWETACRAARGSSITASATFAATGDTEATPDPSRTRSSVGEVEAEATDRPLSPREATSEEAEAGGDHRASDPSRARPRRAIAGNAARWSRHGTAGLQRHRSTCRPSPRSCDARS